MPSDYGKRVIMQGYSQGRDAQKEWIIYFY